MRVEVGRFGDGRSLKVMIRFENTSNFWAESHTWVPKLDEIDFIREVLMAIDEYNKLRRSIGRQYV